MNLKLSHNILIGLFLFCFAFSGNGQDLQSLPNQNPVEFGGGLRMSTQFYNVSGIDPTRSPFAWQISGSPSLSFYGIRVPLSFSFNGQSSSFNTPSFNRFGASPYYKWAKLHVGYRNMNFSSYTLSGKTFLGVGVELKPKNFRFSGMIGRLRNLAAVRNQESYITNLVPDYQRKAYAIKVGYGSSRNYFDVILFRSVDDQSDYINAPTDPTLQPLENLVVGSQFRLTFAKRITLDVNGAVSAFSDDINSEAVGEDNAVVQSVNSFFQPRKGSVFSYAGDAALNFRLKRINFGVKYQRIEPYFRSFGSNFFNNDKENITVNTSFSIAKNIARVNGSFGVERNDLQNVRAISAQRTIGSVQLSLRPSKQFNANLRYGNYQRENRSGLIELNDTLRFVNVAQQSGLGLSYRIDGLTKDYTIGLNINHQSIEDQSAVARLSNDVVSYSASLRAGIDFKNLGLQVTPTANYNRYDVSEILQERYGLGIRIGKQFNEKKTSVNLTGSYNFNDYNQKRNGEVWLTRFMFSTKLMEAHRIGFTASYVNRSSILRKSFREFRSRLTYGITF